MTTDTPLWLLSHNNDSPFRAETREHLRRIAEGDPQNERAPDPRVYDLVRHLESQGVEKTVRIRQWSRDICSMSGSMFQKLHQEFTCEDEQEILRLAAYRSDHSYAHFFTHYAGAMRNGMSETEHKQYAEMVDLITPIVTDLQPRVAIGFAAQILDAYTFLGKPEEAQAIFEDLATKHPRFILTLQDRFKDFPDTKRIFEIAEETRRGQPTATRVGKIMDRQIEASREMGRAW